jgi:hypothetical protein
MRWRRRRKEEEKVGRGEGRKRCGQGQSENRRNRGDEKIKGERKQRGRDVEAGDDNTWKKIKPKAHRSHTQTEVHQLRNNALFSLLQVKSISSHLLL